MWIGHGDVQVRLVERQVVVTAIPDDDVGLFFCLAEDALIVHAGIDDDAPVQMGLVLFALFNGTLVYVHVGMSWHNVARPA